MAFAGKFFFCILLLSIFFVWGCEKAECEKPGDCTPEKGSRVLCVDRKCTYRVIPNICGNNICDNGENFCSCKEDCETPKCEGKYQIEKPGRKPEEARVLQLYCDTANKCQIGVRQQALRQLREVDRDMPFGKLKIKIDYTEPMDVKKKDVFKITLQVTEFAPDIFSERGIELYQISLFSRDRLAEKTLNNFFLNEVRVPRTIEIPLVLASVPERELLASVALKIDYGFTRRDKVNATLSREIPSTGALEYSLPDSIAFIESGERDEKRH